MALRFIVTVKQGVREKARIVSEHIIDSANLTVADVTEKVIETEQFLERITGYRWHIETETLDRPANYAFPPPWSAEKADRLEAEAREKGKA